jgi:glycosyltransferase involved in cell wall biosynthesis
MGVSWKANEGTSKPVAPWGLKQVRIMIAHSFYRVTGGEDRYVRAQTELLRGRHEVYLFGPGNADLSPDARTAARMIHSSAEIRDIEARIKEFRPDLIHLHNPYPAIGPAVHLAAKRQNLPLVMTVHNLRLRCPNGLMFTQGAPCRRCERGNYLQAVTHGCFPSPSQSGAYALALWLHRFVLRLEARVGTFISPSHFVQRQLDEWGIPRTRSEVIRHFTFSAMRVGEPGTFGIYLGRLSVEKGLDSLLRSLAAAGDPPFQIVGEGPIQDDLVALGDQLGLTRVKFTGRLAPPEVAKRLSKARFLVMPSVCHENAPMAVLEAMASGRPVVVSRRGGLPELVERGGGMVFDPGDVGALASNIRLLMNDDDLCSVLGAEALVIARTEFSPARHLSSLERVYRQLAQ